MKKKDRLAALIVSRAREEFGFELVNLCLYPARGYWRSSPLVDVMRWTGYADRVVGDNGETVLEAIGSYDTMTDLLRKGFTMVRGHGALGGIELDVLDREA